MPVKTISEVIAHKQEQGKLAFIPFVVAGDPDIESCKDILKALESSGADIIELGIPYSDPLADGPVIQKAAKRALTSGMSLSKAIELAESLKNELSTPMVIFTYFNPVLKYGLASFVSDVKKAGFKGVLIPDLPIEEAKELIELTQQHEIELIMLVTPTSGDERIREIVNISQGFIYLVSVTGVTGERTDFSGSVETSLTAIKKFTDKPVAVGFGISQPEHVQRLKQLGAQGAIVGSAIVKQIETHVDDKVQLLENLAAYVKTLVDQT